MQLKWWRSGTRADIQISPYSAKRAELEFTLRLRQSLGTSVTATLWRFSVQTAKPAARCKHLVARSQATYSRIYLYFHHAAFPAYTADLWRAPTSWSASIANGRCLSDPGQVRSTRESTNSGMLAAAQWRSRCMLDRSRATHRRTRCIYSPSYHKAEPCIRGRELRCIWASAIGNRVCVDVNNPGI